PGTPSDMIPYKRSGDSVQAVLSGQVTLTIVDPPPATGPLKAGTLRPLAVTSGKRHRSWPDVPTMAQAGVPDMSGTPASAIVGTSGQERWRLPDVTASGRNVPAFSGPVAGGGSTIVSVTWPESTACTESPLRL